MVIGLVAGGVAIFVAQVIVGGVLSEWLGVDEENFRIEIPDRAAGMTLSKSDRRAADFLKGGKADLEKSAESKLKTLKAGVYKGKNSKGHDVAVLFYGGHGKIADGYLRITVRDDGSKIPESEIKKVAAGWAGEGACSPVSASNVVCTWTTETSFGTVWPIENPEAVVGPTTPHTTVKEAAELMRKFREDVEKDA
ncbi:hypothetical protein [Spirillospora sp. CA-294931]|uniref:hypothetical protein n=1 Tax=Spirillospora sp. CA-294931 TaxID=3240042 RepID=UPI003D938294